MRPDLFLATIGRGSNGSNALEVTEDRAAVTAESQDNIINRVNNVSQYGPSWHYVPGIGVAGTAYAEVPSSALGDLAFSRASSKTRTNSAGVVETIGNNVPPHDYRNADGTLSTFPRLNLEPQRTNLFLYSEQLENSYWIKVGAGTGLAPVVNENYAISPSGLQNADRVYFDAVGTTSSDRSGLVRDFAFTSGQTYTISAYVKSATGTNQILQFRVAGAQVGGELTATNEWQRFSVTHTATTTATDNFGIQLRGNNTTNEADLLLYGLQLEQASYATSYIPTTTAAVTRLADLASKTGVSSLIGQTEGTLFFELSALALDSSTWRTIGVSDGTHDNMINFYFTGTSTSNRMRALIRASSVNSFDQYYIGPNITNTIKVAIAYASNDAAFYVNGTQVAIDSSITVPACNRFQFAEAATGAPMYGNINQYALFPTRLTNAELAQLTTL